MCGNNIIKSFSTDFKMAHNENTDNVSEHCAAIILARGGSKGIKLKNIKLLAGIPLIGWVLRAAIDSGVFDSVWVSTDHDEIARVSSEFGAKVFRRSAHTARDNASSIEAVKEFIDFHPEIDIIGLLQCTSPCLQPWHLDFPARTIKSCIYDSVFSVHRMNKVRWKEVKKQGESSTPMNLDVKIQPRSHVGELVENGAFYFTRSDLLKKGSFQSGKVGYLEMGPEYSVDIDMDIDWPIAEQRVVKYGYFGKTKARGITLVVFGIDGVLTDSLIYISEENGHFTTYNHSDAIGIRMLKSEGITVKLLASEENDLHQKFADKLDVELTMGCNDKLAQLKQWIYSMDLSLSQVAYMGNDIPDLECVKLAGIGGAPKDAQHDVQVIATFVASLDGGRGAARDFCNHLLMVKKAASMERESER